MTHTLITAALLLGTIPHDAVVRDEVECIEVNAFHDDDARLVFTQAIFYDAADNCRDWRLVRNRTDAPQTNIVVNRDYERRCYIATWFDGDVLREVRSRAYRETFTQHDRELAERERFPQCRRRLLSKPGRWQP